MEGLSLLKSSGGGGDGGGCGVYRVASRALSGNDDDASQPTPRRLPVSVSEAPRQN